MSAPILGQVSGGSFPSEARSLSSRSLFQGLLFRQVSGGPIQSRPVLQPWLWFCALEHLLSPGLTLLGPCLLGCSLDLGLPVPAKMSAL